MAFVIPESRVQNRIDIPLTGATARQISCAARVSRLPVHLDGKTAGLIDAKKQGVMLARRKCWEDGISHPLPDGVMTHGEEIAWRTRAP